MFSFFFNSRDWKIIIKIPNSNYDKQKSSFRRFFSSLLVSYSGDRILLANCAEREFTLGVHGMCPKNKYF